MNVNRSPLLERPVIREQFRKELRGRLMSEAVVVLAPRRSRFSFPLVLRPALAAAAIFVLVLAGATSAAASSLPGDPLYGVKRATEDVRLAITFDQGARLLLLSDLADRRLEELAEVAVARPAVAPAATQQYADAVEKVAQALDEANGSNNDANHQEGQNVEAAQAKRLATLDSIKATIPDNARTGVDKLIQRERDRRATKPTTSPTSPTSVPQSENQQNVGDPTEATPRPGKPNPERTMPPATPRPGSKDDGRSGDNGEHN